MFDYFDKVFPIRYTVFGLSCFGVLLSLFAVVGFGEGWLVLLVCGALVAIGLMSDSDNTRSNAVAWYGPIALR